MPSNHYVKIPKSDAGVARMAVELLTIELTALSVLGGCSPTIVRLNTYGNRCRVETGRSWRNTDSPIVHKRIY